MVIDSLVDVRVDGDVDVRSSAHIRWVETFANIPVKTPFAINLSQIEYCKGGVNPETNSYELKICFCSGRELWLSGEAAVFLLKRIEVWGARREGSSSLNEKFNEKVK